LTRYVRLGLEVLAGVPSVVFGMFGLALFSVPVLAFMSSKASADAASAFGRSFAIGAVIMALHILPFVTKAMEEALHSVPQSYRTGAAALGLTKWRTTRKVVVPAAAPGIVTAVILGLGLIIGDTAIVWLTVGGTMQMSGSDTWWLPWHWLATIFGTGSTLTTYIFFNSPAGEGNAPQQAYAAAVVLIAIVLVLNLAIAFIGRSRTIKSS
jgi:phosphate transport system permease protein